MPRVAPNQPALISACPILWANPSKGLELVSTKQVDAPLSKYASLVLSSIYRGRPVNGASSRPRSVFRAKIRAIYGLKTKNALWRASLEYKTITKSHKTYIKHITPERTKFSQELCHTGFIPYPAPTGWGTTPSQFGGIGLPWNWLVVVKEFQ